MPHALTNPGDDSSLKMGITSLVDSHRGSSWTASDLDGFLEATAHLDEAPAERLRQLAIYLEQEDVADTWADLERIYKTAYGIEPQDVAVLESWGISAGIWISGHLDQPLNSLRAVFADGVKILEVALILAPGSASIAYALGHLYYSLGCRDDEALTMRSQAENWFRKALLYDPQHEMAQLYLGHCLHDSRLWSEATEAYSAVDRQQLREKWPSWRSFKLQEQLACCLAFAGDLSAARLEFLHLFDSVDQLPDEQLSDLIVNLDDAAAAFSGPLNSDELAGRLLLLLERTGMIDWYPDL